MKFQVFEVSFSQKSSLKIYEEYLIEYLNLVSSIYNNKFEKKE